MARGLQAAWADAWSRGKAWRAALQAGLAVVAPNVRDDLLKLVGAVRSIVPGLDLVFAAPRARYDFERDVVAFAAEAGGAPVDCAVSRETLDDWFDASGLDREGRLQRFFEHRSEIERLLRMKYLEHPVDEPGAVLLKTGDVTALGALQRSSPAEAKR